MPLANGLNFRDRHIWSYSLKNTKWRRPEIKNYWVDKQSHRRGRNYEKEIKSAKEALYASLEGSSWDDPECLRRSWV